MDWIRRSKIRLISSGRPIPRLSVTSDFEERAGVPGGAERQGARDLDLAHRQFPPVAGGAGRRPVSGTGSRDIHRSKNDLDVAGAEPVTDVLQPARVVGAAKPLDSSVKPSPAVVACRFAHSCPLTHTLIG